MENYRDVLSKELLEQIDRDINKKQKEYKSAEKNRAKLIAKTDKDRGQIILCLHILNTAAKKAEQNRENSRKFYRWKGLAMSKLFREGYLKYEGVHILFSEGNMPHYLKYFTANGYGFHDAMTNEEVRVMRAEELIGAMKKGKVEEKEFMVSVDFAETVIRYYLYGK